MKPELIPDNLTFFIPCLPPKATSQQKGAFSTGKGIRFFKKAKVKQAENTMLALFQPYAPKSPMQGAVELEVQWIFPYRKSEKKAVVKAGLNVPVITRPDLDNLSKTLVDSLVTLRFLEDDGQIYRLTLSKFWGSQPGIEIAMKQQILRGLG